MNISIASYSFHGLLSHGMIDLFGYLESCRYRYQLHTADIWNGMFTSTEDDYLMKVKEALRFRELELVNLCVDGAHILEDDLNIRDQNYLNALAYLKAAEVLGAKTIRIDAGGVGDTFTNQQFDLVVKRFREFAQRAYDNGFKVGPENHWGPEVVPENMQRICQAVDHPGFGILLHFRGNPRRPTVGPLGNAHAHLLGYYRTQPGRQPDHAARQWLQRMLGRRAPLRRTRIYSYRNPARTRSQCYRTMALIIYQPVRKHIQSIK